RERRYGAVYRDYDENQQLFSIGEQPKSQNFRKEPKGKAKRWIHFRLFIPYFVVTRPTCPSSRRTLIPWGWNSDLVNKSFISSLVGLLVRLSCFNPIFTS